MNYDLAQYAEFLANERDRYWALYAEFGDRADLRSAKANAMALSLLKIHTNGDFGQLLDEQPGGGWS